MFPKTGALILSTNPPPLNYLIVWKSGTPPLFIDLALKRKELGILLLTHEYKNKLPHHLFSTSRHLRENLFIACLLAGSDRGRQKESHMEQFLN